VSSRDVLVHVGYHKTGTTWLQRVLFKRTAVGLRAAAAKYQLHPLLVHPRAIDFDAAGAKCELGALVEAAARDGSYPVVSSEELCGSPHTGGVLEKEFADRIAAVLPGARILVVVREQKAMLVSSYKQYVRAGGILSLETYLSPRLLGDVRSCNPDWRHFRYDALVDYYRRLFGPDRVLVLSYEGFVAQPADFVRRVLGFCGLERGDEEIESLPFERDVHASLGALGVEIKRRLNPWVSRPDRLYAEPFFPVTNSAHRRLVKVFRRLESAAPARLARWREERFHRVVERWAGDRFRASNSRLGEWMEDDLAKLGYDL